MISAIRLSYTFMVSAMIAYPATDAAAVTAERICAVTGSGAACTFSLTTTAAGNLNVATKPCVAGQKWRATIAKFNTGEVVSQVGDGRNDAFTGRAVRSTTKGARFVVIVSRVTPAQSSVAGAAVVRFTGPLSNVTGPQPPGGSGLLLSTGAPATQQVLSGCNLGGTRASVLFRAPSAGRSPASSSLLPPTSTFLAPTTTLGIGSTGF